MYPYPILFGVDLYTIFLCAGILAAIMVFRIMADRAHISVKLQNMTVIAGACAIAFGCFSAVLFQAFYNVEENGGSFLMEKSTGSTFYGGLIGGAAMFLLLYFLIGAFVFSDKQHRLRFYSIADIAVCSVSAAHALGRVGCLMAGCCHGKVTEAWFGIEMLIDGRWQRAIPIQLFEAVFLLALFVCLVIRVACKKGYCLELYMCGYGVWRFWIEYLRGDERGTTVVDFLTPSQLIAVFMMLGGIALVFVRRRLTLAPALKNQIQKEKDA